MEKNYEGNLVCQTNGVREKFQVKKLNQTHMAPILQVQNIVLENVHVKESLQPLTKEEFLYIVNGMGLILGVFVKNHLVAFRALLYPGDDSENLGCDLNLTKKEQMKVVHQEITCVLPEYRGNGLQKRLSHLIMEEFNRTVNDYRYLCCTVYPTNYPSLKDKLLQGMLITKLKEKYSGSLRYILFKDLQFERKINEKTAVFVSNSDFEQQKALLENEFYGFNLIEDNQGKRLLFAKLHEKA